MKRVKFSNNIIEYTTYCNEEYDRLCIDHVLYRRAYKQISDEEMQAIYVNLDLYKLYEMKVHENSIQNNKYHIKKINTISKK
jgi:hypothetical protein